MQINTLDALRYLGAARAGEALRRDVERVARELEETIKPRYVVREASVALGPEGVFLPEAGLFLPGRLARGMLAECGRAALLLCTLGAEFDRLLRFAQARDMARAVTLDACGSAYVEAGCDAAEREIAAAHPGLYLTDRFSPGYGDLPLRVQEGFLAALNGEKRLGVVALDSLLLAPAKSVTAVVGLSEKPQGARIRGCAFCALRGACAYRERGETCAV